MNLKCREKNSFLPLLQLQIIFRELLTSSSVSSLFLFWNILVCEMFSMKSQEFLFFFPPPLSNYLGSANIFSFQFISILQDWQVLWNRSSRDQWMHNEAKQSERAEFGAERGLLNGQARRTSGSCSKKSQTPQWFSAKCFYRLRVSATGCVTFFSLVAGEIKEMFQDSAGSYHPPRGWRP